MNRCKDGGKVLIGNIPFNGLFNEFDTELEAEIFLEYKTCFQCLRVSGKSFKGMARSSCGNKWEVFTDKEEIEQYKNICKTMNQPPDFINFERRNLLKTW